MAKKTRVMAVGVFDLLHAGHLHYLEQARALGDELVVVIATDASVRKRKGEPVLDQQHRRQLVQYLKPVDSAVIGHEADPFKTVEKIKPDIIALGHDDKFEPATLKAEAKRRGLSVKAVRLKRLDGPHYASRQIANRILDLRGQSKPPK